VTIEGDAWFNEATINDIDFSLSNIINGSGINNLF